jgi:hypothetical protein
VADDLGRKPIAGVAGAGRCRHRLRLPGSAPPRKPVSSQVDGALWGLFNLQGWFYVSAGLVIAGSLFCIRLRARWLYAIPEIGLGLFGLSRSVPIVTGGFSPGDFSAADFDVANVKIDVLISITAVYLIIRGLDNLLQGVYKLRKP